MHIQKLMQMLTQLHIQMQVIANANAKTYINQTQIQMYIQTQKRNEKRLVPRGLAKKN